jgi:hypothetical protein
MPYTKIDNDFIRAEKAQISDSAFRIMIYIWSLPASWKLSAVGLAKQMNRCPDTVTKAFVELRKAGLLEMKRLSAGGVTYTIKTEPLPEKPIVGKTGSGSGATPGKTTTGKTGTNKDCIKESKKLNKKGDEENVVPFLLIPEEVVNAQPEPDDGFTAFYDAYGKKKQPATARRAWAKSAAIRPPLPELLAIVKAQRKAEGWDKDNTYQPYPSTWLNSGSWENEIEGAPPTEQGPTCPSCGQPLYPNMDTCYYCQEPVGVEHG